MWAAQYLDFEDPNRWMTSGGLGTMGYGFPRVHRACRWHIRDALVINVAGEASWLMNMQEMGTAPSTACRSSSSSSTTNVWAWSASGSNCCTASATRHPGPKPARFRETGRGLWRERLSGATILRTLMTRFMEMMPHDGPVVFDCLVEKHENCFPMIPSGKAA